MKVEFNYKLFISVVGMVAAGIISYTKWQSIWWLILHIAFGWFYVAYYILQY